ncbi:hypothetical protein TNCV_3962371 [Trichonephila clavipes]|nr:hypothetical protein TNCV_3962371 [Trichonephila clavipes]
MGRDPLKVDVSIFCYGSELSDYSNAHEVIHSSSVLQFAIESSIILYAEQRSPEPDDRGYELVSSVRALVPQKFSVEEELMHVKHVEVKSPHVGVMWKFGRGVISSGIILVT